MQDANAVAKKTSNVISERKNALIIKQKCLKNY